MRPGEGESEEGGVRGEEYRGQGCTMIEAYITMSGAYSTPALGF